MATTKYITKDDKEVKEYLALLGDKSFYAGKNINVSEGKKYLRVFVQESYTGGKSAVCFIDRSNGNILYAASWAAPAKHPRGNIYNAQAESIDERGFIRTLTAKVMLSLSREEAAAIRQALKDTYFERTTKFSPYGTMSDFDAMLAGVIEKLNVKLQYKHNQTVKSGRKD